MRTLKLQVQMTVDGFIAGVNGEMDWMEMGWDAALQQYVGDLTSSMDTIVLGRKLAEGFIPYWASVAANPEDPQHAAGKVFTDTPKVVFSKTLDQSPWDNTVLAKSDLTEEIDRLKQQDGKAIIAYGGGAFVSDLIKNGLVDELHLFINPTAIGKGMTIFGELDGKLPLKLVKSTAFDCGIIVNHYAPKR
jgi:dihydrofolate reductase